MRIAHLKGIDATVLVVKVILDPLQIVDQSVLPIKTVHQIKLAASINVDLFVVKEFAPQQQNVVQLITLQSVPVLMAPLEIHFTAVNIFLLHLQKEKILAILALVVRVHTVEISEVLEVVNVLKITLETPTPVVGQSVLMTTIAPVRNLVKIQNAWIHVLVFVVKMLSVMYDSTCQVVRVILATKEIHFQRVIAFQNHHHKLKKNQEIHAYLHLVDHTVKREVLVLPVNALVSLAILVLHQTVDRNVLLTRSAH